MGKFSSFLTLLALSLLSGAQQITRNCEGDQFTSSPAHEVEVANDVGLRNVCIRREDTNPELVNVWHYISCPNANTFRSSGDTGDAVLCQNFDNKPGIGVDFAAIAPVNTSLDLVCETSTGTTINVIESTLYIRDNNSIVYDPQSEDGTVRGVVGQTIDIAKFVGLLKDLQLVHVQPPLEMKCVAVIEDDNCRYASDGGESELTMTCRYTSQSVIEEAFTFTRNDTNKVLATVTVNVRANNTEPTPLPSPPTELGLGGIVGIALGVIILAIPIIAVLVLAIIIIWRAGPGVIPPPPHPDPERGEVSAPHYDYAAFGRHIPANVKKAIMALYSAEEYNLNGLSVEERFAEGSEKLLCVTSRSEFLESPSGDINSSLTSQMRHLENTQPHGRVNVVQIPDEKLHEVEGAQDTDGVPHLVDFINEQLQHQPARRPSLQRQSSTDSRVLAGIHSIHRLLFNWRVESAQATNGISEEVASEERSHSPSPPAQSNGQALSEDL